MTKDQFIQEAEREFEVKFPELCRKVRGHPDDYYNGEVPRIIKFISTKLGKAYELGKEEGLHTMAIKADKVMIDWLKNNTEGVKMVDDIKKVEYERGRAELAKEMRERIKILDTGAYHNEDYVKGFFTSISQVQSLLDKEIK